MSIFEYERINIHPDIILHCKGLIALKLERVETGGSLSGLDEFCIIL